MLPSNMKTSNEKPLLLLRFGQKIRQERLKQRLSQEQLAEKAELHRTYIGMIERGEKNITLNNISKISSALGIKIAVLFENL